MVELNVVANARLYFCIHLFIEPSLKKKTTKSCRFCKVNIKVLDVKLNFQTVLPTISRDTGSYTAISYRYSL